jgi:hypothetical protein
LSARALPLASGGTSGRGGDPGPPARVLIDGRNVQHALARSAGAGALPTAALVARLRAAFASPTQVELILDGHPGGSPQGRVSPGFSVTFTKSWTADAVIAERVAETFRALGAAEAWSVLVISDDRAVRDDARRNGVRVERTSWLVERLRAGAIGGAGASIGAGRAPGLRAKAPREPRG